MEGQGLRCPQALRGCGAACHPVVDKLWELLQLAAIQSVQPGQVL